jgi:hypothetical protein
MQEGGPKILFEPVIFRAQFAAFDDEEKYTDQFLCFWWDTATSFISDSNYGIVSGKSRRLALNLLTAHLIVLINNMNKNKQGGFVQSSTIDKIAVTKVAPPANEVWDWWLTQTPYGQQLLALLQMLSVGGFYIGGAPESSGFRGFGGEFG